MSITTSEPSRYVGAATAPDAMAALSKAARTVAEAVLSALHRLDEGRRKRRTLSQLRSMDDRFLRDIGLPRSAINSATFGSAREQARRWHG